MPHTGSQRCEMIPPHPQEGVGPPGKGRDRRAWLKVGSAVGSFQHIASHETAWDQSHEVFEFPCGPQHCKRWRHRVCGLLVRYPLPFQLAKNSCDCIRLRGRKVARIRPTPPPLQKPVSIEKCVKDCGTVCPSMPTRFNSTPPCLGPSSSSTDRRGAEHPTVF